MFDKFFEYKKVESNANYALLAGIFFTLISFITSYFLFHNTPSFVSIATILFSIALTIPILFKFFESTKVENKKSFFSKTRHLFDFYIYFFIGSFIVFFLLSLAFPSRVLTSDQLFGTSTKLVLPQQLGLPAPQIDLANFAMNILSNNFYVMVICFVLSLLYGAGSLLLLSMNAAIFASTLGSVIRQLAMNSNYVQLYALMSCNMGVMFFHLIPEVMAYILAAIAGGMLSVAVAKEKIFSKEFLMSAKNAVLVFLISIPILVIAALIESYVSRSILLSNVCLTNTLTIVLITILLIVLVVVLEVFRRKRK